MEKETIAIAAFVLLAGIVIATLPSYVTVTGTATVSDACGSGRLSGGEECELPNTIDNEFCPQSTSECEGVVGPKTASRDSFGDCNRQCGCVADSFGPFVCVQNSCSATCDEDVDCPPNLDEQNDICLFSGTCDTQSTCACNHQSESCPEPGTEQGGECFFGTQDCDNTGCTTTVCTLDPEKICDPQLGCVTTTTTTSTSTTTTTTSTSTTTTTEPTTTTTTSTTTTTEPTTTSTTTSTTTTTEPTTTTSTTTSSTTTTEPTTTTSTTSSTTTTT